MSSAQLRSRLTCPQCGHSETLTMAEDACLVRYACPACRVVLEPKPGDCCVFCSYADTPCPPVQLAGKARRGGQDFSLR